MKIYVAAVEALRKKERQGQNKMKLSLYFFLQVLFWESHPVLDQTQGSGVVFSWLKEKLYYYMTKNLAPYCNMESNNKQRVCDKYTVCLMQSPPPPNYKLLCFF